MKFTKHVDKDPDFPERRFTDIKWLSDNGRFKIKEYFDTSEAPKRAIYAAYHKPIGWTNFGNHVDRSTHFYQTVKAAKEACERHFARNPGGAYQ